jgi:hypothetical protein
LRPFAEVVAEFRRLVGSTQELVFSPPSVDELTKAVLENPDEDDERDEDGIDF